MIGLIDPALLLPRAANALPVEEDVDWIIGTCRAFHIEIPALQEYWPEIWLRLGMGLESTLTPQAKRALQALRRLGTTPPHAVPPLAADVWRRGFRQLFGIGTFATNWEDTMARAAARAISLNDEVVLFTRRIPGRNLRTHTVQHCSLHENTRWVLHVQVAGIGARRIKCVYHRRNISEPWTVRFDWRLPSAADGARYPFCPPQFWWKGHIAAVRTVLGKPAWVDAHNNGWCRPNTPGNGYHWDVFLRNLAHRGAVGVTQINVVEFGAPAAEGAAGTLHHIPTVKAGAVNDVGWHC